MKLILGICIGLSIAGGFAVARDLDTIHGDKFMETIIGEDNRAKERSRQEWDRIYNNNRRNPC